MTNVRSTLASETWRTKTCFHRTRMTRTWPRVTMMSRRSRRKSPSRIRSQKIKKRRRQVTAQKKTKTTRVSVTKMANLTRKCLSIGTQHLLKRMRSSLRRPNPSSPLRMNRWTIKSLLTNKRSIRTKLTLNSPRTKALKKRTTPVRGLMVSQRTMIRSTMSIRSQTRRSLTTIRSSQSRKMRMMKKTRMRWTKPISNARTRQIRTSRTIQRTSKTSPLTTTTR